MHIEEMFDKLDEDGGGTLSIDEITSLFKENGIHMTEEEVADMFAAAGRMHLVAIDKKQRQTCGKSNIQKFLLEEKGTDFNLKA